MVVQLQLAVTERNRLHIVKSSTAEDTYRVDLLDVTCTCPDFQRRADYPKENIRRFCKHLAEAARQITTDDGSFEMTILHKLHFGIPELAELAAVEVSGHKVLFMKSASYAWCEVVAKAGPSGPYDRFGFHCLQNRWSYGKVPTDGVEIRQLISGFDAAVSSRAMAAGSDAKDSQPIYSRTNSRCSFRYSNAHGCMV
jgi:hypothetical protein